jgi:hypothetical protein
MLIGVTTTFGHYSRQQLFCATLKITARTSATSEERGEKGKRSKTGQRNDHQIVKNLTARLFKRRAQKEKKGPDMFDNRTTA